MSKFRFLFIAASVGFAALASANVASLTFDHAANLNGGALDVATGTITLAAPAGPGGVDVSISEDGGGLIDLGGVISVHIDEGQTTGTFTAAAPTPVKTNTIVHVTADDGGSSAEKDLLITPMRPNKLRLHSRAIQYGSVGVTIELNGPTANDLVLDLTASPGMSFAEGSSVTVPAGHRTVDVTLQVGASALPGHGYSMAATVHASGLEYTRSDFRVFYLEIVSLTADSLTLVSGGDPTTMHVKLNATVSTPATLKVPAKFLGRFNIGSLVVPAGQNTLDVSVSAKLISNSKPVTRYLRVDPPLGQGRKGRLIAFTVNPHP